MANRLEQLTNDLLDLREETPGWAFQVTQSVQAIMVARANLAELSRRAAKHDSWEDEQTAEMATARIVY